MKNIKKKFEVLIRLTLTFVTFFTSFGYIPSVFASNYANGEIIDATKIAGSVTNPGDVKLEKTLTKAQNDGEYTLTLTVTGKNTIITQSQTAKIYTVVVLDTSGSMDNCWLCIFQNNKYEMAKNGAKAFARSLLSSYPNSELALVTFDNNVRVTREFRTENFDNTRFPSPSGATNLGGGINKANELLLQKKESDPNAKLYMVVLGDGLPEGTQTVSYTTAANTAHTNGIEVFTIAYDVDKNSEEERVLKSIATDASHYKNSSGSNIVEDFTNIAGEIEAAIPAGTDSVVIDKISEYFDYVPNTASEGVIVNGQNVSLQTGEILESGKSMSFNIKVKDNLPNGIYPTNEFAKVTYTDKNGNNREVAITDSPKINVETYTYKVKYVEQGTGLELATNKIVENASAGKTYSETAKTVSGYTVDNNTKTITISEDNQELIFYYTKKSNLSYTVNYYQDSTSGTLLGSQTINNVTFGSKINANDITVNAYKPTEGYKDGVIVTDLPYTIIDGENVINVVYSKKNDLSYTVEYYNDDNEKLSADVDNTVYGQTYHNEITEQEIEKNKYKPLLGYNDGKITTTMPYIIGETRNVIKVVYEKRTDMGYTVKYLESGSNAQLADSESRTGKTYLETYEETAKSVNGYTVDFNTKNITVDAENKELVFYYTKRSDLSYTVKYLENGTNKVLAEEETKTGKVFDETYEETAKSVNGYTVDSNKKSVKVTTGTNEIVFYYTRRNDLSYTVEYYNDDNEKLSADVDNTVYGQTYHNEITEQEIEKNKYKPLLGYKDGKITTTMPYIIEEIRNVIKVVYEKRTDMSYTVNYLESGSNAQLADSESRTGKTYLETYEETAKQINGYTVDSNTKNITVDDEDKILIFYYEKRNDFKYTVKYLEKDTEAELAPSKTVTDKTYLGTYNEEAVEIKGYNPVGRTTVEFILDENEKEIVFYYTIKNNLTYRVEYYYDGEIDSSKTENYENITYGTVIDTFDDKQPDGYKYVSDTAPITIDDVEENVIKVFYESIPQGDITPPNTGIELSNNFTFASLISLIGMVIINKKKENN